jgi:thioredoxin 2
MIDVRCEACGATNRVPRERAGERARCGKCKAPLATKTTPLAVTDADFESLVLVAPVPVLLDCWAEWCGPCHTLAPTIDALARDYAGRVRVAKLDVDANPVTADRLGVRGIPALFIFRDGRLVDRLVGVQPRAALDARLRPLLAPV